MRPLYVLSLVAVLSEVCFATKEKPHLPCEFTETVSRKYPNTAFPLASDAMKRRATKKVDISHAAKQFDVRGTIALDVLVGADGNVVCAKGVYGHPMLIRAVEEAVRQWRFRPIKQGSESVAYVGRLDFTLCNIGCGKNDHPMSLLP
jgi:Gram-negative bacterial TonB protein C-terminal